MCLNCVCILAFVLAVTMFMYVSVFSNAVISVQFRVVVVDTNLKPITLPVDINLKVRMNFLVNYYCQKGYNVHQTNMFSLVIGIRIMCCACRIQMAMSSSNG